MQRRQSFSVQVDLPPWLVHYLQDFSTVVLDDHDAMRLSIALSAENIKHKTGGPFGAVITNAHGRVVTVGVNLVLYSGQSWVHAEMLAITLAQIHTGCLDLREAPLAPLTLYSSGEPCAMCLGAIPWSGINRLVIGAREEDIARVGFDEGDKPIKGLYSLERWGVGIVRDVLRDEACAVLSDYARAGGQIYQQSPVCRDASHD